MPSLPTEIWRDIVQLLTHTSTYFELSPDPQTWPLFNPRAPCPQRREAMEVIRTAHTLTLVSHFFAQVSSEFLFRVVYLISAGSARRLADVFDRLYGHSKSRWPNTQYLLVALCPPDQDTMPAEVTRVLRHCRSLRAFTWDSQECWGGQFRCGKEEYVMVRAIPQSLQLLDWKCLCEGWSFSVPTIRRLRFLKAIRMHITPSGPRAVFKFPHLTHLDLNRYPGTVPNCAFDWLLPALTHLSIWHANFNESELLRFEALLASCSTTLVSINLGSGVAPSPTLFMRILRSAPNLQKLAYTAAAGTLDDAWANVWHASLVALSVEISWLVTLHHASGVDIPLSLMQFHALDRAHLPALQTLTLRGLSGVRESGVVAATVEPAAAALTKLLVNQGIVVKVVH